MVGVTVIVRTWPVTVSSDVTGVGLHVDVEEDEEVVCTEELDDVLARLRVEGVVGVVNWSLC